MKTLPHKTLFTADETVLVVGLGATGASFVRWATGQGCKIRVVDSREQPPGLEAVRAAHPDLEIRLGEFDEACLVDVAALLVSPGVPDSDPLLMLARQRGLPIYGDTEIFAEVIGDTATSVIAVTGSNGKSTVVSLLGVMAEAAKWRVVVAGNIGYPVLDALLAAEQEGLPDLFVLELSSFQLERTHSLKTVGACILNVSADHMDRYKTFDEYAQAKSRIYSGTKAAVVNVDDSLAAGLVPVNLDEVRYSLSPLESGFGVTQNAGELWLAKDAEPLIAVSDMGLVGAHNHSNALAALALGNAAGLPMEAMLAGLQDFKGLPHRMQFVAEQQGVTWVNDSKGTNVGATVAALQGLNGRIVLIAGGQGKGQDFKPLRQALEGRARAVVLMGEDASLIARAIKGVAQIKRVGGMTEAVHAAASLARSGDMVLLSPACASFDLFKGFEARGDAFVAAVEALGLQGEAA